MRSRERVADVLGRLAGRVGERDRVLRRAQRVAPVASGDDRARRRVDVPLERRAVGDHRVLERVLERLDRPDVVPKSLFQIGDVSVVTVLLIVSVEPAGAEPAMTE